MIIEIVINQKRIVSLLDLAIRTLLVLVKVLGGVGRGAED